MVVGVFSVRRAPGLDEQGYAALNDRMWQIVSSQAFGLIGITGYKSADGRSLAMAFFENREGMLEWKHQVEHAAAQQQGRDEFFLDYWGFVAEMIDAYEFEKGSGRKQIALDSKWLPAGFEGPAEG